MPYKLIGTHESPVEPPMYKGVPYPIHPYPDIFTKELVG